MTNQLVMAKKSRSRLSTAKVARAIGIFVLGCVVFATKHAIQQQATNSDPANMVRRSAEVMYNSIQQKEVKQPSAPVAQKLKIGKRNFRTFQNLTLTQNQKTISYWQNDTLLRQFHQPM